MQTLEFVVSRTALDDCGVQHGRMEADKQLDGQVLLQVQRFSFTANNITYAVLGEALRYWEFFPAPAGQGIIPVWGFAEVVASHCAGIEPGERFYGYYPMASHLLVMPKQVKAGGFTDGCAHRALLPSIYNQYLRCSTDALYRRETEALQMLLRPLFTTSFLLEDFLRDNQHFGAECLVVTSASSKTAIGLAFLLQRQRAQLGQSCTVIGLTSPGNLAFTQGLGCYDQVLGYDQWRELEPGRASVLVDFSGNAELMERLHAHLGQLRYSCRVGASHWTQRGGRPKALPGPTPSPFFAPSQAEKRLAEWGGAVFQQRLAESWHAFLVFVTGWLEVETRLGPDALLHGYREVLAGQASPKQGLVLSLFAE
ncbi:MAG: DUF2855 family protein [Pseudomonas sp.]|uniref:DUF2855 family protein n=1 Tax=Pseudomonas sp. TaxID=306 RepID=UPI0033961B1B